MRILLLSRTHLSRNPQGRTLMRSLARAGHDVVAVCGASTTPVEPDLHVIQVPTRSPQGLGRLGWLLRRLQPARLRRRLFDRALLEEAGRVDADLIYPLAKSDLPLAMDAAHGDTAVVRRPHWPHAGSHDLVEIALRNAHVGIGRQADELGLYMRFDDSPGSTPDPDRYRNVSLSLVFHRTTTTPAQYLERAAQRAGIKVTVHDGRLDWATVERNNAAVVIVESPYPPIEIEGENTNRIPVLYWVHHGEHHLDANLRLTEAYGADAVLLAHSWHLAHRFPVPVHRFPFAVASELVPPHREFADRSNDVALVGAGVDRGGGRYARRHMLASELQARFPDSCTFTYGITPADMTELYGDSRIVLNDGGDRHHPITMRIFEAIGSGAFLLTDPAPGLELLLDPDRHYALIENDIAAQASRLIADSATAGRASGAHDFAMAHHTYDHRIDDLMTIAAATEATHRPTAPPGGPFIAAVLADPDVQEIAAFGFPELADDLPTHIVWDGPLLLRSHPQRRVDAVVIGPGEAAGLEQAIRPATRFLYADPTIGDRVWSLASAAHPQASRADTHGVVRIDLAADSYRLRPADHPLAGS